MAEKQFRFHFRMFMNKLTQKYNEEVDTTDNQAIKFLCKNIKHY